MTKLINLDEITSGEQRKVRFKGVEHEIVDMDVRQFVQFQAAFNEFSKAMQAEKVEDIFIAAEKIVAIAIPTLSEEHLRAMKIAQVMATVQLILNLSKPADSEAPEAAPAEGNAPATE